MPTADKIDLKQAQLIIQELREDDLHYGGQEGSSLRKRLNLSKGSRFTSTITTLQPLFDWITSDPRFTGSRSIQAFVHAETDHLKNSSPYLYQALAKPSNPADKKKFCWGTVIDANANSGILSNGKKIKPLLVEQLEGYLEGRCKELFGLPSTPPPVRTFIPQEANRFSLEDYSYEIRGRELIVKKILEYFDRIIRTSFNLLHSGSIPVGTVVKPKFESEISLSSTQESFYLKRMHDLGNVFKIQESPKNFILIIEGVGSVIEFNRLKEYNSRNTHESDYYLMVICTDQENRSASNHFKEVYKKQMMIKLFEDSELKGCTDKMFIKTNKESNNQSEFGKTELRQTMCIDYFDDYFKEAHKQKISVRFFEDDEFKNWPDKMFVKTDKENNNQFEFGNAELRQSILRDSFYDYLKEVYKQQMIIRFFEDAELKDWVDKMFVKTDKESDNQYMSVLFFEDAKLKGWTDKMFIKTNKESNNQFEIGKTKSGQTILRDYFENSKFKGNKEENTEEVICIDQEAWIVSIYFKEVHKQQMAIRFFEDAELKNWGNNVFIKTNKQRNNQFEKTKPRQVALRDYFADSKLKSNKEESSEDVIIKERECSFDNMMWCLN